MDIAQSIVNGIAVGSIIALGAIGLTLSLGILKLSNFAHGDFMTLGAYITWVFNAQVKLNLWLSMGLGAIATVMLMLLCEQILWKPMRARRADPTTLIIISIGLALFIRNGILFIWGGSNQNFAVPLVQAFNIGGLRIGYYRIIVVALAIVAMLALHYILAKTKIGKAMRAVADSVDLAKVSGINVQQVVFYTWIITGIFAASGGVMYGLITNIRPNMGWFLILPMFASVILGGIGNAYGAILGGLIIGVAQELSVIVVGSNYKLAVSLIIMIVILLVRPQGLFKGTG